MKQKITCECGCISSKHNLQKHKRTLKHKRLLAKKILNKFYKNYIKN